MKPRFRIGTRGSALGLRQAQLIQDQLRALADIQTELVTIRTSGDRPPESTGTRPQKGIFIREIEDALLTGTIDMAVHSLKDLPTELPAGLTIAAVGPREDVHDVLVSTGGFELDTLPAGSRVGTSSLRRRAQLWARRSDIDVVDLRGNVDKRLQKLKEGQLDALVLAMAGLIRLGFSDQISQVLPTEVMLPAAGQGALAVEARIGDEEVLDLLRSLDHRPTRIAVMAERALLRELHGGCQIPVGAWARVEDRELFLDGCVVSLDGRRMVRDTISGPDSAGSALGSQLASRLLSRGADRILEEVDAYRTREGGGHDAHPGA